MQDENQAVEEYEIQSQYLEKDIEVEEMDEEGGGYIGRFIEYVVMVIDGGGYNELDVGNQKGSSNVYNVGVTYIGSSIFGY